MLLERDLIQSVGFRNVRAGGRVTGFQFRVRMPSYRGMAASLIDGIAVRVGDLVDVAADVPRWSFGGTTYSLAELWDSDGVRWQLEEPAVVTVPFEGGLPDGVHEVSIELRLRMSYVPVEHQPSTYRVTKHVTLSPEADGAPFRYGVSLYSFMGDYGTVLDLETALAGIADIGATGVEILGEAHIPNYPEPAQEWVDEWFRLLERYGLEPTNYGSWIDTRLHSSGPHAHEMSIDEGAAALQRDLRLAHRLGFRFVRPKIGVVSSDLVPHPIWSEAVERSLPLAEELDLIICPEIHSPTPIRHEVVEDYIALITRTGTKHFGLLIDTGIFQDRPIALKPGELPGQRPAFMDGIAVDPGDFASVAEHVVFIQAKFHDIDDTLEDQQIPWEPVLRAIKDAGYTGYLSSEYEGEREPWRSIEQVRRHHSLMRQVADRL
ncbi:sugar phosphate isomerase/epimerase [Microbacterium sp. zg.B48]|uniref:sugar phosphate isomerase/epimerase n=1 Tax=Microbacterium sp. zg.B48 TaxID=2969408 RepID=UPI00214AC4BA|nr:sugar phosphate isomerase/epimerase [Microbacterium sp. zg.B48]MCR2762942.1 sugar phosphate isomerase/epimerase [Microbacterium sp. zg.B48]